MTRNPNGKKIIKVLLIEDDIEDFELIEESLSDRLDSTVILSRAENLTVGLELIKNEIFDVILLDLGLPESSGLETFNIVNKEIPGIPIVVFTGLMDDEVGSEAIRNGAQDYLIKGTAKGELLERALHYAIERKSIMSEKDMLMAELNEKNQEFQQVLHIASHDLRSPLINIQGFSQDLSMIYNELLEKIDLSSFPENEKKRMKNLMEHEVPETFDFIESSVKKMEKLIDGLLHISRIGRVEMNVIDLNMNDIIETITRNFRYRMNQGQVEVSITDLPETKGDENLINQAMSNILDNALKYLDSNRQGSIRISGRRENGSSVYSIKDNGIGIPSEYQQKVFDLFHRVPGCSVGGEGLGLSAVKKIIDRHHGRIWVESRRELEARSMLLFPVPGAIEVKDNEA